MKRTLYITIAFSLSILLTGCSSQRDVNVEVVLKTGDTSVTIVKVHFTASNNQALVIPTPQAIVLAMCQ